MFVAEKWIKELLLNVLFFVSCMFLFHTEDDGQGTSVTTLKATAENVGSTSSKPAVSLTLAPLITVKYHLHQQL